MTASEKYFVEKVPPFIDALMTDMKCGLYDACAVFGNSGHESLGWTKFQEMRPVVKGSRGGFGIMQWTGPRRVQFEKFCADHKLSVTSLDANYQFLLWELKNTVESRVMASMYAVVTLREKVEAFEKGFLRAGVKNYASRERWSEIALTAYKDWKASQPKVPDVSVLPPPVKPSIPTQKGGIIGLIIAALGAIGFAIGRGLGIW